MLGWGSNSSGQSSPAAPSLLRFSRIALGGQFTTALTADGTVSAWGRSDVGQTSVPSDLRGVSQIACGGNFSYALRSDGSLVPWGDSNNGYGVLDVPPGIGPVIGVFCGGAHVYALRPDRTAVGWGLNTSGQTSTPSAVQGLIASVDCGSDYTYALLMDGTLRSWGANLSNQRNTPPGLAGVRQVDCGGIFTYALLNDGTLRGWGSSSQGELNHPNSISDFVQISCGTNHSYALRSNGTVIGWGSNSSGQRNTPAGLAGVQQVVCSGDNTYVLKNDGSAVGWGNSQHGQNDTPQRLPLMVQVACGGRVTLGLKGDGTVIGFGSNYWGQRQVPQGLVNVVQVACGDKHAYALTSDRSLVGWGNNGLDGCLNTPSGTTARTTQVTCGYDFSYALRLDRTLIGWGRNNEAQRNTPGSATNIVQVSCGSYHVAAVRADGTVVSWGWNAQNQSATPPGLTGVTQVACGALHTYARKADGTLVSWGFNNYGQRDTPAGAIDITQVVCGTSHTVALRGDGAVLAWGGSGYGEQSVPDNLSGVTQIATGPTSNHSVALLGTALSTCANATGLGVATLRFGGSAWEIAGVWQWANSTASHQVPGALSDVTLGEYGSVGSLCDAQCATLRVPSTSTLLVPVDLSQPLSGQDHSIDVGGLATLRGRVWLLASGAGVLPADFSLPVVNAGAFDGLFSIIETTVPPPAGKFLTLVPTTGLVGGGWSLALRDLPSSLGADTGTTGSVVGTAVSAEAMDYDGDGYDDLALAIDNGAAAPGTLQVILNDGTGNLGSVSYLKQTAARPTSLGVGDVNGDGNEDAVVGTASDSSARVYLNAHPQVSPPFSDSTQLVLGGVPLSAAVLPWPDPRVAVGTSSGTMAIFNPASSTALQSPAVPATPTTTRTRGRIIVTGGANPSSVDGLLPPLTTGRLVVLTPDAAGLYAVTQQVDVPGKPVNLDIADIDRDGIDDAMTANVQPQQPSSGTPLAVLTLFRGTAVGFTDPAPIAPQGASAGGDVAMVDVNADGVRDIVSVHQTLAGQSVAAAILVNQDVPGGPLTLGTQDPITATRPILCPRGDVRGPNGEGVYIIDAGSSAFDGGASLIPVPPAAIPYRAHCRVDLDGDNAVDGADLAILLGAWGTADARADLDRDGTVAGADLALLLGAWGPCGAASP